MTLKRRARPGGLRPSEAEWAWLTAAPECNEFLGFGGGQLTTTDRLRRLWEEHGPEIRAAWRESPPEVVPPYGHPIRAEMADELLHEPLLDPRRKGGDADPDDVELFEATMNEWRERRRAWFRTEL